MKSIIDFLVATKDLFTSIAALVQLIVITVNEYVQSLNGMEINYGVLIGSLAIAIDGWYTGKKPA